MATTTSPAEGTEVAHRTAGPDESDGDAAGTVVRLQGTGDRNPDGKAVR